MRVYAGGCEWKDEFEVEQILDHRGPVVERQYKIRWKGHAQMYDTWEPRDNLHHELIKDYELTNNVYDYD